MRIVVLGGTGFIGGRVVHALVRDGHDVTVFHRGQDEPNLPASVRHIHGRFERLPEYRSQLQRLSPEVVLDMIPYLKKSGHGISHFAGIAERAVVISSGDVYRAFGRLWRSEPGTPDPVPLREDAPLRSFPASDRKGEDEFDNLEAECAARSEPTLAATILRLPATHGPGDRQHRLARYVRAMADGRPAIVLGETLARWRWSRAYVENVADAIALAVGAGRAAGRTYNVASSALSEADWIRAIAQLAGWAGEVVVVADEQLPAALRQSFDFTQHLELDTTAIRSELGFRESVAEPEGLERTIEWELQTLHEVPDLRLDYAAEDVALAATRITAASGSVADAVSVCETRAVSATDSDPVALQHFELVPEPVPAEVLGAEATGISMEVWALRISGGPVREVLTTDPANVVAREYVFALPLDVMGKLARRLTEVYEKQSGSTL